MSSKYGFTLLEMMISIALASIVLTAVNQMTISSVRLEENVSADGETMNQVQTVIAELVSELRSAEPASLVVEGSNSISYRACIGFIGSGDFSGSDTSTDNMDSDNEDYVLFGVDNFALGTNYEYVRRIYLDDYDAERETWTLKQDRGDGGDAIDTSTVTLATDVSEFVVSYDTTTARLEIDLASTAQVRDEVVDDSGEVLSNVTNTNNARLQIFMRSQQLSALLGSTAISSGSLDLSTLTTSTSGFDTTSFYISSTGSGDGITGTIQVGGDGALTDTYFEIRDAATGNLAMVTDSDGNVVPLDPSVTYNGNIINFTAAGLDKGTSYKVKIEAQMDGAWQDPAYSKSILVEEVTTTGSNPGGGSKGKKGKKKP